MKKLKRRLSSAFRSASNNNVSRMTSNGSFYDPECDARSNIVIGYGILPPGYSLSESMSHLSDKLAVDGAIMEECVDPTSLLRVSRGGTAGRRYETNVHYLGGMHPPPPRTHSLYYPRGYNHQNSGRNSYYGSNALLCPFGEFLRARGPEISICDKSRLAVFFSFPVFNNCLQFDI
ncbi:unnamed protein product [Caenorhabditis bovis]|uniref:Uncharacterized protein n=1 Tax=Caenorhabditis bovis TaxID=2654633 RepID=A0A8S1FBT8_9PELO|nr:unnamed protein product [Caenorhabditis bovis]